MQYFTGRTKSRPADHSISGDRHAREEGSSSGAVNNDPDSANRRPPRKHKNTSQRPLTLEHRVMIESFLGGGSTEQIRRHVEESQARKEARRQRAAGVTNPIATGVESSVRDSHGIHYRDEAERDEFRGLRTGRNVHLGGRSRSTPRASTPSDDQDGSSEEDLSAPSPSVVPLEHSFLYQRSDEPPPAIPPMRRGRPSRPKTAQERAMQNLSGDNSASASFFSDSFTPHNVSSSVTTPSTSSPAFAATSISTSSTSSAPYRRRRSNVQSLLVEPTSPMLAERRAPTETFDRGPSVPPNDGLPLSSKAVSSQHPRLVSKHSSNSLISSISTFTKKLTSRDLPSK